MNSLEDFLNLPDVEGLETDVFVSKRLGTFTVSALTADEYSSYLKRARKVDKKGKIDFDANLFNLLIIDAKLIKPDFSNAEFLKKAKCSTAKEFISKKLLPGEIQELSDKILEFSGFDKDINEDIDEAKN